MDPTTLNPNVMRMVAALKQLPQPPQSQYVPNYAVPVPNLNPNLAKAQQRVQMISGKGPPKPTAADW